MELFRTIRQIAVFMICAQAILHFKPSAKYEKYLKLLISVMVLVQLLLPFLKVFSWEEEDFFYTRMETIQAEMEKEMAELKIESTIYEESVLKETEEEIKTKVNLIASKNELIVCYLQFDVADSNRKMVVYVKEEEKTQDTDIHIDRISIDTDFSFLESTEEEKTAKNDKLQALSEDIHRELGIDEKRIEVLWYE